MGLPRTAPGSVLFASYNTLDLFLSGDPAGREHYQLVLEVIRDLQPDVLAVQEIRGAEAGAVQARMQRLAADTGLRCLIPNGETPRVAVAMGTRGFHSGLLWRDGIEAVPGSFRAFGRGHFWHSLACVTLDVGGRLIRHASFHATPFGRTARADQNERLVAMTCGPAGSLPLLIGADWNTESADRVRDPATGRWVLYEPRDPYQGGPWFDDLIYQCDWDYDEHGQRRHWVDRRPGDVLWAGGLHDAAAALGAPWQATTGHHPGDRYGSYGIFRRIDAIRVTRHVLGALRGYSATDTDAARRASDHLPVTVEYLPAAVAAADPSGRQ
jgi:endonuclease/exonuclease/phosphatase family metal-dependent hydrolase